MAMILDLRLQCLDPSIEQVRDVATPTYRALVQSQRAVTTSKVGIARCINADASSGSNTSFNRRGQTTCQPQVVDDD